MLHGDRGDDDESILLYHYKRLCKTPGIQAYHGNTKHLSHYEIILADITIIMCMHSQERLDTEPKHHKEGQQ